MKKIFYSLIGSAIFFTGCLKDTPNTDFSTVGTLAEIGTSNLNANLNAPSGGLDYFKQATLPSFSSDAPFDVTFDVNIASPYPPTKDVNVTLTVDDSKRAAYNALGGVQYDAAPDSIYSFAVKSAVIKAGSRLAQFTITFYPAKLDISHSYLVPVTISDASGIQVSSNLGTIYIHNLGNPLAGVYTEVGGRYNYTGLSGWTGSGAYPGGYSLADLKSFVKGASPENTTVVDMDYANLGGNGYQYVITWNGIKDAGAKISVAANGTLAGAVSNFAVYTSTIDWNGGKPILHIVSFYNNGAGGSGSDRIIDETFTHQ